MPTIKITATGKTVDVSATTAGDMIRNGYAVAVSEKKAPAKKAEDSKTKDDKKS